MTDLIPAKFSEMIESAIYVWCTTVQPDGVPHTTPIWFLRDGETFFFYTIPTSQKVKNLKANPNISLSFAKDEEGENYFVVIGTAEIDSDLPAPHLNEPYMSKYKEAHYMVETTPEKYSTIFSLGYRIFPSRVRGE